MISGTISATGSKLPLAFHLDRKYYISMMNIWQKQSIDYFNLEFRIYHYGNIVQYSQMY